MIHPGRIGGEDNFPKLKEKSNTLFDETEINHT